MRALVKKTKSEPLASVPGGGGVIASAVRTLEMEREGLDALASWLRCEIPAAFEAAVRTIRGAKGRVIVTGIGKSGLVGQKIAATLASTGTPAYFVHATEANHGDLGMISRDDVICAVSWSGETVELKGIITYSRRFRVPLIAITCNGDSSLAQAAEIVLTLPKAKEACPHGLAPTTSTTMQMALGDALAIALLESRGFTALDFKAIHPGGSLGASLKHVGDLMHKGAEVPLARADVSMAEALVVMTEKSFGCIGVIDDRGRLVGMITDGDLRRHMSPQLLSRRVSEIMTRKPVVLAPQMLASQALEVLNSAKKTNIFVVKDGLPVGILHVHDLLRAGVA